MSAPGRFAIDDEVLLPVLEGALDDPRIEIAARQLRALRPYNPPRAKKLRLSDVHEMFQEMKDRA